LGLGEAGGGIAADLRAAGVPVRGYDPLPATRPDVATPSAAAAGANLILSLTTAAEARTAARSVLGALGPGQIYADANTAGAALKRELAARVEPTGARFADLALMAPVPGRGVRTPAVASGPGARTAAELLGGLGMPVTVLPGGPGAAATRKLLRSVAWKGAAAVVNEALAAARAADVEPWMRRELVDLFAAVDEAALRRMEDGTRRHAARRAREMADACALLRELGVTPPCRRRLARPAGGDPAPWLTTPPPPIARARPGAGAAGRAGCRRAPRPRAGDRPPGAR
jgi:3-hydroxyisobutyrate dehydrogenase-like beta-hydroxyacid dehydrogenase